MDDNAVCCPKIDVGAWHNKIFDWQDKLFVKANVKTFFYIPLNFGKVITKVITAADEQKVKLIDCLCLSDHESKWNMAIYLAVDKKLEGFENVNLSGKFLSRVYEGRYKDTKIWCDDYKEYARENGYLIKKWYMWYCYCPKCAKKYGKNYTAIISEIVEK